MEFSDNKNERKLLNDGWCENMIEAIIKIKMSWKLMMDWDDMILMIRNKMS
jgi:hypothetical protein